LELTTARLAGDFAAGLIQADARNPRWGAYQPGIGPHTEVQTVALVLAEPRREHASLYGSVQTGVPYPNSLRQKCDLLISPRDGRSWAVEVKMLRLMGDNGKPNDNMLLHILSPYPSHRSALTDCRKLAASGFSGSLAVLIYGYDYDALPMEPAVEAFEQLAGHRVRLGPRQASSFEGLLHPVHRRAGWGGLRLGSRALRHRTVSTCMPSMLGGFTKPCGVLRSHATAQVREAARGWMVGRREATRSAVSGKSLARNVHGRLSQERKGRCPSSDHKPQHLRRSALLGQLRVERRVSGESSSVMAGWVGGSVGGQWRCVGSGVKRALRCSG
jgi:hypothetical protein